MATPDSEPVALRIPAILQNPVNRTQKQVEAHNAQQREKVEAKRERLREARHDAGGIKGDKRGKRVIRRSDNAAFASNPHIVRPSRSDYAPPFPMMSHPPLPLNTLPRSSAIPPADVPAKDPFSTSSVNGAFSTSIKGIRQALRKKGRRTEVVVQKVEDEIRGWLSGHGTLTHEDDCEHSTWNVIDDTLLEDQTEVVEQTGQSTASGSRRIPQQHRVTGSIPPLPIRDDLVPAILELSRSAGHLTWLAVEGFERLVVHLIARYYEVVSWSEDHVTASGQKIRLTHIIRPAIVNPRPLPTGSLVTPDNSDLSAPSSSDLSSASGTETETDSDTATEMGESIAGSDLDDDGPEGYTVPRQGETETGREDIGLRSPTLESAMNELHVSELALRRTYSNSSSQYAESEGGSDYGMADSLTLPPAPAGQAGQSGWVSTFDSGPVDLGAPPAPPGVAGPKKMSAVGAAAVGKRTWQDKPTFFEYLYGA